MEARGQTSSRRPRRAFPEINNDSVAILLSYGTPAPLGRRRPGQVGGIRGRRPLHQALYHPSTFRNYTHSEPRFRVLLLTGKRPGVQLALG
jgi:hypothetical protein